MYHDVLESFRISCKDETIDLIYLDPPFNSKTNYNVIFKTPKKEDSPSQIQAFEDTWKWNSRTEFELHQLFGAEPKLAELMKGLKLIIGKNDLLAYLVMMAIRLRELHRVLKDTGSLYLHCDSTASHYLKIILDAIFGITKFRNEIIWKRNPSHEDSNGFGDVSDTILFYGGNIFKDVIREPLDEETKKFYKYTDFRGDYRPENLKSSGLSGGGYTYNFHGHLGPWRCPQRTMMKYEQENRIHFPKKEGGVPQRKRYLSDHPGIVPTNIWTDIKKARGNERMGYPTQKPIKLLERIIKASSNEGDVILDPFCGCGTAIVAAQRLNRYWIGMDITHLSIGLMEKRIFDEFKIKPKVVGNPASFISAENLFKRSPLDFERWAVTRIDGMHPNKAQVGDKGIDGRGYIGPDHQYKTIISVKGGKQLNPGMVRDLEGTVSRENANFGVLITIHNPTDGMKQEAAKAGIVEMPLGHHYPKIQIYTISDYFNGKKPELP